MAGNSCSVAFVSDKDQILVIMRVDTDACIEVDVDVLCLTHNLDILAAGGLSKVHLPALRFLMETLLHFLI